MERSRTESYDTDRFLGCRVENLLSTTYLKKCYWMKQKIRKQKKPSHVSSIE